MSFDSTLQGNYKMVFSEFAAGDIPWCWPGSDTLYIQRGVDFYTISLGLLSSSDDSASIEASINAIMGAASVAVVRTATQYELTFAVSVTVLWEDARCNLRRIYNGSRSNESGVLVVLGGESVDNNPDLLELHIDAVVNSFKSGRAGRAGDVLISRTQNVENEFAMSDTKQLNVAVQRLNADTTCPMDLRWDVLFVPLV